MSLDSENPTCTKKKKKKTDHHQLTLILGVLGTPSLEDFYQINSQRSRDYLRALPFQKKKPLESLYPNANPLAIDLLDKCLAFNPKKRSTVEAALAHPYLDPYHDPDDEPVAPVLPPSFFAFDQQQLSREQLKSERFVSLLGFLPISRLARLPRAKDADEIGNERFGVHNSFNLRRDHIASASALNKRRLLNKHTHSLSLSLPLFIPRSCFPNAFARFFFFAYRRSFLPFSPSLTLCLLSPKLCVVLVWLCMLSISLPSSSTRRSRAGQTPNQKKAGLLFVFLFLLLAQSCLSPIRRC